MSRDENSGSDPAALDLWSLERIEPSTARGERVLLGSALESLRVGRAEDSDVRLLTASASRQHANLVRDESGCWWIHPSPDRSVGVDGEEISSPCLLEEGLNLQMGGDQLRCRLEWSSDTHEPSARPPRVGDGESEVRADGSHAPRTRLIGLGVALLALVLLVWNLFGEVG